MPINKKLFIILFFCVCLAYASITSAHVLKIDSTIGAVLHVDPEDDPIVGQPTRLFLEFKDKADAFTVPACDCRVTVRLGERVIFTGTAGSVEVPADTSAFSFTIVPPERGIYTIAVEGAAVDDSFAPFRIEYDVRVERTGSPKTGLVAEFFSGHGWHLGVFVGAALLCVILVIRDKHKEEYTEK